MSCAIIVESNLWLFIVTASLCHVTFSRSSLLTDGGGEVHERIAFGVRAAEALH